MLIYPSYHDLNRQGGLELHKDPQSPGSYGQAVHYMRRSFAGRVQDRQGSYVYHEQTTQRASASGREIWFAVPAVRIEPLQCK